VVFNVDTPPAQITQVANASGVGVDQTHAARVGDVLNISLSGLYPATGNLSPAQIQVSLGGVTHAPIALTPLTGSAWQVTIVLNGPEQSGQAQQLVVYLDGRSSYPVTVPVARADGTFAAAATDPADPGTTPDNPGGSN
jgi:hypothetical protein